MASADSHLWLIPVLVIAASLLTATGRDALLWLLLEGLFPALHFIFSLIEIAIFEAFGLITGFIGVSPFMPTSMLLLIAAVLLLSGAVMAGLVVAVFHKAAGGGDISVVIFCAVVLVASAMIPMFVFAYLAPRDDGDEGGAVIGYSDREIL